MRLPLVLSGLLGGARVVLLGVLRRPEGFAISYSYSGGEGDGPGAAPEVVDDLGATYDLRFGECSPDDEIGYGSWNYRPPLAAAATNLELRFYDEDDEEGAEPVERVTVDLSPPVIAKRGGNPPRRGGVRFSGPMGAAMEAESIEFERMKAIHRLRLVEALLKALDTMPAIWEAVSLSLDTSQARSRLMSEPFSFREDEAVYVLDMQVRRATRATRKELEAEMTALRRVIEGGD